MRLRVLTLSLVVAACGGDDGSTGILDAGPGPAMIDLPDVIALPYVVAGAGTVTIDVEVENDGGFDAEPIWSLTGEGFTLVAAPDTLAPNASGIVTIQWDGSAVEAIASASLTVEGAGEDTAEVWAVAGDAALDPAAFAAVAGAGGVMIGESAVVPMPTAPYPATGRPWTDDRVHVFVPEGYRQADAHDLVLHFHGHNTTIDATIPAHHYREQVYASGANVILVVPQGPVNAASGDFGKLSDPLATDAFLHEVLIVLYRAGAITRPVLGDVILTAHSGGYVATSQNLAGPFAVPQVQLYDAVYGYLTTFRDYALAGGRLRSNYTPTGGTDTNNLTLAQSLETAGATVHTSPTTDAMLDPAPLIYPVATSHEASTRIDDAYGEHLRWGARRSRRGPRVELRSMVVEGDFGILTWRAPADPELVRWTLEKPDGEFLGSVTGDVSDTTSLEVYLDGPVTDISELRLVSGLTDLTGQVSDTVAVADSDILVVDGFDRVIDGSFGGLTHDFAARIAAAAGGAETATSDAVTEDGFDLSPYRVVIWFVGDDSTDDHSLTLAERDAIDAYIVAGGRVILSGSEIGYDLAQISGGPAFLTRVAGATYASDDAGTNLAGGWTFGDDAAPYREEYPDVFTGTTIFSYATGGAAAVGVAGRGAIVGFPLETIADDAELAAAVTALIEFVAP